tara:strand:+ start:151 stop:684 length:534 start_codon:yes stop_codon:yes gene_type:complete
MERFFSFNGTISGSSYILRMLMSLLLFFIFLLLALTCFSGIIFSYMNIDLASLEGISMAESNTIGEEAGLKIAEEMMEMGPIEWLYQNISFIWMIVLIITLGIFLWFSLSSYYKRISAIFFSNRVKMFVGFILISTGTFTLLIMNISIVNLLYYLLFNIFLWVVLSSINSPIGEHDG